MNWELDDLMDLISMIADRKDYNVNMKFISDNSEKNEYKVWEIKNI